MSRSKNRIIRLIHQLFAFWHKFPRELRRVFLFTAVTGLPIWLTITSYDVRSYVIGTEQILSGRSVYRPRVESHYTDQLIPRYPYLPSFAILLAVIISPFFFLNEMDMLPNIIYEVISRQIANSPGYVALLAIPILTYKLCSDSENRNVLNITTYDNWVFWGVIIVILAPPLWFQVIESGSDTFVALLSLLGIYAVMNNRWKLAGLLVGISTFKFTAIPLATVLAIYSLKQGRDQFLSVIVGGVVSQLPNIIYFITYREDLLYLIKNGGTMTLKSGRTRPLMAAPLQAIGLEQWYIETGFVFVFILLTMFGALLAIRQENLLLGFSVSYLSSSYFAPVGEINTSVLIIFLLVGAAVNFDRGPIRYLTGGLLSIELYSFLIKLQQIDYISARPLPFLDFMVNLLEFVTVIIVLIGLVYFSEPGRLHTP